jgi:hypothetical protein
MQKRREKDERNPCRCNMKVKHCITKSLNSGVRIILRRVLPKALHLPNSLFAVNIGVHHAYKNLHLRGNLQSARMKMSGNFSVP